VTAAAAIETQRRVIPVANLDLHLREGGEGDPVVILHRSIGTLGWGALEERLAQRFRVITPDLPGYGESERPDWAREPRDLALLVGRMLERLDLTDVTLVGLGFGGFVAAELATANEDRLRSLVLVSSAGLKPREGEIVDQMLIAHTAYVQSGFADEASYEAKFGTELHADIKDIWEFSRIMTARVSWSPYMFSRRLAPLLCEVKTPALVVWGDTDRIIPKDCGMQYVERLANARLEVLPSTGHFVEWDAPDQLADRIAAAAAGN
jgi:pimeloyl-ACP methyl ester carboxylesterase